MRWPPRRVALKAAADRARSLGSFLQALHFLEQALEVTSDPEEERGLRRAAGNAGLAAGLIEEPSLHMGKALELARGAGDRRVLLDAIVNYAFARSIGGQLVESAAMLEPARDEFGDLGETVEFVRLNAELARTYLLLGRPAEAVTIADETLPTAERLDLPRETLDLIVTRGPALASLGRTREAIVTLVGAVSSAASNGWPAAELRARVNLSFAAAADDPRLGSQVAREGLELARHLGLRGYGFYLLGNAAEFAVQMGDWDWALAQLDDAVAAIHTDFTAQMRRAQIRGLQGMEVEEEFARVAAFLADTTEVQAPASLDEVRAEVAMARGDFAEAHRLAKRSYTQNIAPDSTAPRTAGRTAAWLGQGDDAREALDLLAGQPGRVSAVVRREIEAALAALDGRREESLAGFVDAIRRWHELGVEFEAAVGALDLVIMLGAATPEARAAADEAAALFRRLDAQPLLDRLDEATRQTRPSTPPAARVGEEARLPAI
jgi:tetratricopeptide (TPR) repeat protein